MFFYCFPFYYFILFFFIFKVFRAPYGQAFFQTLRGLYGQAVYANLRDYPWQVVLAITFGNLRASTYPFIAFIAATVFPHYGMAISMALCLRAATVKKLNLFMGDHLVTSITSKVP